MANSWIVFVKAYAKKHNMSYREAMKKAKPSYKKKDSKTMVDKKVTGKGKGKKK